MRKRPFRSCLSLLLTAALMTGTIAVTEPVKADETASTAGTTYYIDAESGDDAQAGTSEAAAWKTFANVADLTLTEGDQVLLKAGCVWNADTKEERLVIRGAAGTKEHPVVLGRYGEGEDPVINGKGNPWQTDTAAKKEDVAVVHVYNSKYITIENLEVTNWETDSADLLTSGKAGVTKQQSKYLLTGILVENHDAGVLPGVVIRNNYVHNVNGYMSKNGSEGDKKGSGGIMALVTSADGAEGHESSFEDLQIAGNEVENVCHEAIYMESCWAARTLVGGASSQQAGAYKWVGWKNVSVENNYVHDVAGDGIVLINCDGGMAQNNLILRSASEEWDYSNNPAHAAIWMWDCNNVTMQYNEAAFTESTQDGMAFDCDYGNQNVMYQYNYSHDNKGGFWMACPGPYYTVNSIVRYNVSVNDGLFDGSRIIRVGEKGSIGHQVYNNTIYWDTGYQVSAVEQGSWGTPPTGGTDIYNNIFYGNSGTFVDNAGTTYSNNCVWGAAKDSYLENVDDVYAVICDPKFTDVTDYTTGSFADGMVTLGKPEGFRLQADSGCIDSGRSYLAVPEESLDAVSAELVPTHMTLENRDYAGNTVPYASGSEASGMDIGAFEAQTEGVLVEEDTDKSYLQSLLALAETYQEADFTASSWAEFKKALTNAQITMQRSDVVAMQADRYTRRLEEAMTALQKDGAERPGTAEDDILSFYASASDVDNADFEKTGFDWGYWQATREISTEQAHSGSQSLKIIRDEGQTIGYSELGNIPVEPNTAYICEAWIYCEDSEVDSVGLEAKHHNSYTSTGSDIKLATASAALEGAEGNWKKIVMELTTQEYNKISLAASSSLAVTYLDHVVIYPKTVISGENLDRTGILAALEKTPEYQAAYYAPGTWKSYENARTAARLKSVDALASQEELNQQVLALNSALSALTKRANNTVLTALCQAYAAETQGNYTSESWTLYQTVYRQAAAVAANEDAAQTEVDAALQALLNARGALQMKQPQQPGSNQQQSRAEQTLTVKDTYEKIYGDEAFNLSVRLTVGNGTLTFASSDENVASVSPNGKVTVRGTGICTITVTASQTANYHQTAASVKLTVKPQAVTLKNVKSAKGKKLNVSWNKGKAVTGYQIQYSTKSNFKSGTKTVTVKKSSAKKTVIRKLKAGKKYYVRIRTYKNVSENGRTQQLCSAWSKAKRSAKIKK